MKVLIKVKTFIKMKRFSLMMAFLTAFITFNIFHAEKPTKDYGRGNSLHEMQKTSDENLRIIRENIASSQRALYISLGIGLVAYLGVSRINAPMKKGEK